MSEKSRNELFKEIIDRHENGTLTDEDIDWLVGTLMGATTLIYRANDTITDLRAEVFAKDIEISELNQQTP